MAYILSNIADYVRSCDSCLRSRFNAATGYSLEKTVLHQHGFYYTVTFIDQG